MAIKNNTIRLEKINGATLHEGQGEIKKIRIGGHCPYDEYDQGLSEKEAGYLSAIIGRMAFLCESKVTLSKKLLETVKDGKKAIGYVFKEQGMRLYCKQTETGFIVYNGGREETKADDDRKFIEMTKATNERQKYDIKKMQNI